MADNSKMMREPKLAWIIGLFILSLSLGCKSQTRTQDPIPSPQASAKTFDFELLKEWVPGKRIVALGESTHGIGEFFALKSEIVQYLKSQSTTDQPLILSGFDPQNSGTLYDHLLDQIVTLLDFPFDLEEEFSFYVKMYQATFEPDSSHFSEYKQRYQGTLAQLMTGIEDHAQKIQSELSIGQDKVQILLKILQLQYDAVDYAYQDRVNAEYIPKGIALRDALMAETVKWITEELYPGKKIILWGHNAHLQSGPFNGLQTQWMGQYLKEAFGDAYFSIGMFAHQGEIYQHWDQQTVAFENAEADFIEQLLSKGRLPFAYHRFTDKSQPDWVKQEVRALEPENNGVVRFVPGERFDAAICILKGMAPEFE